MKPKRAFVYFLPLQNRPPLLCLPFFPDQLTNPSRTILTAEGGSTPSRFKHIIETKNGYRRLTPIELERLNGFPDDWTRELTNGDIINDGRRAFFMGNALVVGLVAKVGKILAQEIKK